MGSRGHALCFTLVAAALLSVATAGDPTEKLGSLQGCESSSSDNCNGCKNALTAFNGGEEDTCEEKDSVCKDLEKAWGQKDENVETIAGGLKYLKDDKNGVCQVLGCCEGTASSPAAGEEKDSLLHEAEKAAIDARNKMLNEKLEAAERNVDQAETDIAALYDRMEALTSSIESKKNDLEKYSKTTPTLKSEVSEVKVKEGNLQKRLAEQKRLLVNLEKEVTDRRKQKKEEQEKSASLKSHSALAVGRTLKALKAEKTSLQTRVENCNSVCSGTERRITELDKNNEERLKARAKVTDQLTNQRRGNTAAEEEIASKRIELSGLGDNEGRLKAQLDELIKTNERENAAKEEELKPEETRTNAQIDTVTAELMKRAAVLSDLDKAAEENLGKLTDKAKILKERNAEVSKQIGLKKNEEKVLIANNERDENLMKIAAEHRSAAKVTSENQAAIDHVAVKLTGNERFLTRKSVNVNSSPPTDVEDAKSSVTPGPGGDEEVSGDIEESDSSREVVTGSGDDAPDTLASPTLEKTGGNSAAPTPSKKEDNGSFFGLAVDA